MMKKLIMTVVALLIVAITSCTESTDRLGNTLTTPADKFSVTADTFEVSTRSIKVDSVLSRSVYSYIGRLKDPETGSYITSDFMTQFNVLEKQSGKIFPNKQTIADKGGEYEAICDSCFIRVVVNSYQGDSLASMMLTMRELGKPVKESGIYYTNFDPEEAGYLRDDDKAIRQNVVYSMVDLTENDSVRNAHNTQGYYNTFEIPLNSAYTSINHEEFNNYGSYVMSQYYSHPEYFKNSKAFIRNVCPGFYFQCKDGLGVMTEVAYVQLVIYYHYKIDDVTYAEYASFNSTEEVLQTTHITNNKESIDELIADNECTYLKTPAGIYTEVTLPIEDIKSGHENDTITSARIVFSRMNEKSRYSDIVLEEPTSILMVEADSLYSFFEKNSIPNNKTSFLATFNTTYKTYTFNNLSTLINHKFNKVRDYITNKDGSIDWKLLKQFEEEVDEKGNKVNDDWNKVVLIPVQVETSAASTTSTVSTVSNEMNVNSVRLVGGSENKHVPVRISIIYNRNNQE